MDGEKIKYPSRRVRESREFWLRVYRDLESGLSPEEIRSRYKNPKTGKNYSREHIYWVIAQIEEKGVDQIMREAGLKK